MPALPFSERQPGLQNAEACPVHPPEPPQPSPPLESLAPVAFTLPLLWLPALDGVALHIPVIAACVYGWPYD